MINLLQLEIKKLIAYKIILIGLATSLLLGTAMYFSSKEEAMMLYSTILFIDVVVMGMLLTVSNLFFERQEATLKSLIVSPISKTTIIFSKFIISLLLSLLSVIILSGALYLNVGKFDLSLINLPILIPGLIATIFFHTTLGFVISYNSKDFNGALVGYMVYAIFMQLPSLFATLIPNVPEYFNYIIMVSPSEASNYIFSSALNSYELWKLIFSFSYLVVLGSLILFLYVVPNFVKYVSKGD